MEPLGEPIKTSDWSQEVVMIMMCHLLIGCFEMCYDVADFDWLIMHLLCDISI